MSDRRAGGSGARWLLAVGAALGVLALLAAWLAKSDERAGATGAGARRETSTSRPSFDEAVPSGPASPEAAEAPRPVVTDAAPHARAGLDIAIADEGELLTTTSVRIAAQDEDWTEVHPLDAHSSTSLTGLTPGRYRLECLDEAWRVEPSELVLAEGQTCQAALHSRYRLPVRVVGARTGRFEGHVSVGVVARDTESARVLELGQSHDVFPVDGRFTLLGLPPSTPTRPYDQIQLVGEANGLWGCTSGWIPASQLPACPEITLLAAELAVTGQVTRSSSQELAQITVYLISPFCDLSRARLRGDGLLFDQGEPPDEPPPMAAADGDGRYGFPLALTREESFRVLAFDGVNAPALSATVRVPPAIGPVTVDLALPPGGAIHGRVHLPVGTTSEGKDVEASFIVEASAQPVQADRLPMSAVLGFMYDRRLEAGPPPGATEEFQISGLPVGEQDLDVRLETQVGLAGPSAPARTLHRRLTVKAGETTEVELDAAEPVRGTTLHGLVILPECLAGVDVAIALYPDSSPFAPAVAWTHANADGHWEITDVPVGDAIWTLKASAASRDDSILAVTTTGDSTSVEALRHSDEPTRINFTFSEVRIHSSPGRAIHVDGRHRFVSSKLLGQDGLDLHANEQGLARVFGLGKGEYFAATDDGRKDFDLPFGPSVVDLDLR